MNHQLDGFARERLRIVLRPGRVHQRLRVAERLPQRVTGVRHDGCQHLHDDLQALLHDTAALGRVVVEIAERVDELHGGRDGGVELVTTPDVVAGLGDGGVGAPPQLPLGGVEIRCIGDRRRAAAGVRVDELPQLFQEAERALHGGIGPFQRLLRR